MGAQARVERNRHNKGYSRKISVRSQDTSLKTKEGRFPFRHQRRIRERKENGGEGKGNEGKTRNSGGRDRPLARPGTNVRGRQMTVFRGEENVLS